MDDRLQRLLALAFEEAPGIEATTRIQQVRERLGEARPALNYEVLLDVSEGFDGFATRILPRLVYHLESLGIRPPQAEGVFLSLFVGERLYFVHARDAFALAGELLGIGPEEMLRRWGTGELRTAVTPAGPPVMLPGGEET